MILLKSKQPFVTLSEIYSSELFVREVILSIEQSVTRDAASILI